ncbi:MAG TPA: RNA polymerase subunit sigma-70 [Planctomycetaceae bacterium]|nr:RNA polymerase subunit sigma-70 [Planctomycetaceae bacterium]
MHDSPQRSEFVRLWMVHGQRIYAYLLTLMSNHADADEIYQDVGMTLWEKFDQFTPGSNFQAWARQVALNKVRSFRRLRHHQTVLCSPEFLDAVEQTIAEDTELLDKQYKVWSDCFDRLPSRQKDLIDRRYRLGETPKNLSERTGRSLDAIYQALSRIHRALFDCVREATFGESTS